MQIIAESEREKKQIIELSKYLHDFRIHRDDKNVVLVYVNGGFEPIRENELLFLDSARHEVLGFIQHLYANPDQIMVTK